MPEPRTEERPDRTQLEELWKRSTPPPPPWWQRAWDWIRAWYAASVVDQPASPRRAAVQRRIHLQKVALKIARHLEEGDPAEVRLVFKEARRLLMLGPTK